MVNGPILGAVALTYMALLFGVAWLTDRQGRGRKSPAWRAAAYTLSIAVLSSSWTYFGSVGVAAQGQWVFAANMIGPVLALTLLGPVWRRIGLLVKQENVGSIADFLSARYGKSRAMGSLVALVAIVAALPYIALQFRSLAQAWSYATGESQPPAFAAVVIAVILGTFAILFGTRRPSLTQLSRGLVRMVAVESLVKLGALASVAAVSVIALLNLPTDAVTAAQLPTPTLSLEFLTATLLCAGTALTLPRQFHVSFVTLENVDDIAVARRFYPIYMLAWLAAIIPIAMLARFNSAPVTGDLTVLSVASERGGPVFMVVAFLGGVSAGTAMVVVETTALSAMMSNELVLPMLARTPWLARGDDAARTIVAIRRIMIVLILGLALAYYRQIADRADLATLGFTSLAASIQLLPALLGGVIWRGANRQGAIAGILGGMAVWFYMTEAPQVVAADGALGWLSVGSVVADPRGLFNLGVLGSLAANAATLVAVSRATVPRLIDRIQSDAFVPGGTGTPQIDQPVGATMADLRDLTAQFLGAAEADEAIAGLLASHRPPLDLASLVTPSLARSGERVLAGAIGASSARNVIALYLADKAGPAPDFDVVLDEAAHAVQFSRELLQRTLDSLDQGVCVIDGEQRLVAWNTVFANTAGGRLRVGADLFAAMKEAPGLPRQELVATIRSMAIEHRSSTVEHQFEGRTTKIVGVPLSGGDFMLNFSDVTQAHAAAQILRRSNEELEKRVGERTQALTDINAALERATEQAEHATRAQRRFVAAASHDLLQPLHAARLFLGLTLEDLPEGAPLREGVVAAEQSIDAADRLLRALLNLSRLEVGGLSPARGLVDLGVLLATLRREFEPLARARGLRLVVVPTRRYALSDPDLLRSVLQNLIGNAIRYTVTGSVLVGCRVYAGGMRIEVRDSGPGLAEESLAVIFNDFTRLDAAGRQESGAGLGLAIAERICHALGHELAVRSAVGRGSLFSVRLPSVSPIIEDVAKSIDVAGDRPLSILCVDNERDALEGLRRLLERWGHTVDAAMSGDDALAMTGSWDVALVDYQLGGSVTGIDVLKSLGERIGRAVLVTASPDAHVLDAVTAFDFKLLTKPLASQTLRQFLRSGRSTPTPLPVDHAPGNQQRLGAAMHAQSAEQPG